MWFFRRLPFLLAAFGWLAIAGPVSAADTYQVKDEGKFFSTEAVQKADQRIQEIQREFHKTLFIDTVRALPADMEQQYKEATRAEGGKDKFFSKWAVQRARAAGVQGIYVFICRDPAELKIEVDDQTLRRGFTAENRRQLAKDMLALLKQKKYDQALLDAVDFVASTLGFRPPANPRPKPFWTQSTSSHRRCGRTLAPGVPKPPYPPVLPRLQANHWPESAAAGSSAGFASVSLHWQPSGSSSRSFAQSPVSEVAGAMADKGRGQGQGTAEVPASEAEGTVVAAAASSHPCWVGCSARLPAIGLATPSLAAGIVQIGEEAHRRSADRRLTRGITSRIKQDPVNSPAAIPAAVSTTPAAIPGEAVVMPAIPEAASAIPAGTSVAAATLAAAAISAEVAAILVGGMAEDSNLDYSRSHPNPKRKRGLHNH